MITIIFGAPGVGKSALSAYFLKKIYFSEGDALLERCKQRILAINRDRGSSLTLPEKPPIYADYRVKFLDGYEKTYEPYYINGYYFGLENENMPTQFLPPESKVFFSEAQRYFDSRKSQSFPGWVSRAFEKHRHYGIDIYMDLQRPGLIDVNIRDLCRNFIEVEYMDNLFDPMGGIEKSVFHCREFTSWGDVERYLESGEKCYRETAYVNEGDIFRCFDSFSCFNDFLPSEGKDFSYLSYNREDGASDAEEKFYSTMEPEEYRARHVAKPKK